MSMRYCDGVSRRSFMRIGGLGLGLGGLSLPNLLRAEDRASAIASAGTKQGQGQSRPAHKSAIMIYLSGGLAHQDTFDLKPNAPEEVRGEFQPIATNVPGIEVCELLPCLAQTMDKIALLRAVVGLRDEHTSFQNLTGFPMDQSQRENKPHFGSVVSRLLGPTEEAMPPFIDLFPVMQHRPYNSAAAGFLGQACNPAKLNGDDLRIMRHELVSAERSSRRRDLLSRFDQFRRTVDTESIDGMEQNYRRAYEILTSSKIADALDLSKEDPRLRDRYGHGSSKHLGDGAPLWNDQLLIARRLVEAGARVVTVAYGFWDTHGNNFKHLRQHLPTFDQGIAALIDDIHERGLDQDVSVIVWGEFGRTPKINKDAGRDHWAKVNSALLAGGGMKVGQVLGATDKIAGSAVAGQVHYQDVLATVYRNLGIDPHAFIPDPADRPLSILPPSVQPIARL